MPSELSPHPDVVPIGDYALIGDSRSAALVARDGSLDWLCWPRFDSPSLFAALLDPAIGGRFRVRPAGAFERTRRYLPGTNVLETTFTTATGSVALRDLMPVADEDAKGRTFQAEREVLREVEGLRGEVEIEVHYEPRPGYATAQPKLRRKGKLGIWCRDGQGAFILTSDVPLTLAADGCSAAGRTTIRAGERAYLSLVYSSEAPAVIPPLGEEARTRIARSVQWWEEWTNRCAYQGPYREAVVRSALALKLLAYAPSGAVIAAPTTSLPEQVGGEANWDYRYCWLRDAAFTVRALQALGYTDEACRFVDWALHATRLTWPTVKVYYDVYGESKVPEKELPHLAGYAGSRPVRVGNAAHDQFQLDVYGELVDAVARYVDDGGQLDRDTTKLLNELGATVCQRWPEPDHGIWELRGEPRPYTHSKALAWVALDRLIILHERHGLDLPDLDRFRHNRTLLRETIERDGYDEGLNSYTQTFGGDALDASLLTLSLYGYVAGDDQRMQRTCDRIHERLARDGLLFRYDEGPGKLPAEGAFGACCFWAVECRARGGDLAGAIETFERLLGCANDLGLYAEEIDPSTGAALGNFPQGLTHLALINAALTLAECGPAPAKGD